MSKAHLKNVRLSFPSIFQKAVYEGVEGKYEATFLISKKDTEIKKILDDLIKKVISESKVKIPSDKVCLKDGDERFGKDGEVYDGYEDHWSLKASNEKRPTVINRDKSPLTEEDEVIYAGCYVNAVIDFWVQNNSYGRRLNANLYGVQFLKDGEAFGIGPVDVINDFDELDENDDL